MTTPTETSAEKIARIKSELSKVGARRLLEARTFAVEAIHKDVSK